MVDIDHRSIKSSSELVNFGKISSLQYSAEKNRVIGSFISKEGNKNCSSIFTMDISNFKSENKYQLCDVYSFPVSGKNPSDIIYNFEAPKNINSGYNLVGRQIENGQSIFSIPVITEYDSVYGFYKSPQFLTISTDNRWAAYVVSTESTSGLHKFYFVNLTTGFVQQFSLKGPLISLAFNSDNTSFYFISLSDNSLYHFDIADTTLSKVDISPQNIGYIKAIPSSSDVLIIYPYEDFTRFIRVSKNKSMLETDIQIKSLAFSDFIDEHTFCFTVRPNWWSQKLKPTDKSNYEKTVEYELGILDVSKMAIEKKISISAPMEMCFVTNFFIIPNSKGEQ